MPTISAYLIGDDHNKRHLGNEEGEKYSATSVESALHSDEETHALIGKTCTLCN